jgi:hypothetical protein
VVCCVVADLCVDVVGRMDVVLIDGLDLDST